MRLDKFKAVQVILSIFIIISLFTPLVPQAQSQLIGGEIPKNISPTKTEFEPGESMDIEIVIPGGTENISSPADVMLVMDKTGSMITNSFPGQCPDGNPCGDRLKAAKEALKIFVDSVGDFVYTGFASYASRGIEDCRISGYEQCVTLDYGIKEMNAANKMAIKQTIDDMTGGGGTPIGAGMHYGNLELTDQIDPPGETTSVREDVPKFMILATDGKQNIQPYPTQNMDLSGPPTILEYAKENDITVYTLGIASSPGSVDENLLKQIACETDKNDDDPCVVGSLTGNVPSNPKNYRFVSDFVSLADYYKQIAAEITRPVEYAVVDILNLLWFEAITSPIVVVDCATDDPWAIKNFDTFSLIGNTLGFTFTMDPLPEGTNVCIRYTAKLKDLSKIPAFGLPITIYVNAGWVASVEEGFTCDNIGECANAIFDLEEINIQRVLITIINPLKPWLKTTDGDVGSRAPISNIARDPDTPNPGSIINADYLLIGRQGIHDFFQTERWRLPNYGLINIDPEPTGNNIYNALKTRYPPCGNFSVATEDGIKNAINGNGGCRVLEYNGATFTITPSFDEYEEDPVMIFVSGDILINSDFEVEDDTGIIFVTDGDVRVNSNVEEIDGIFIANGSFNSSQNPCGTLGNGNKKLEVNGAIYAFTELCFTRDLSGGADFNANKETPAELINFQPRYLYLFQDIVGDDITIYREVAP